MKPVLERRSVTDGRPLRLGEKVLMDSGSPGMVVGEEWHRNSEVVVVMGLDENMESNIVFK